MAIDKFPIRLKEARLMMDFSMDKLVERTGGAITKQSISRYERGIMRPKRDAEAALAKALNISKDYFCGTNLQIDLPMLRTTSGGKFTEEELVALEAKLSFWAEQYLDKEKKAGISPSFRNPIPKSKVSTIDDAIKVAEKLREKWHCGDGVIASVLRLLERKGVKILSAELPNYVYGLSTWADKVHPLILLDLRPDKTTVERLRFTAAHELAHLLLTLPKDSELSVEKRCDLFAGFFLLSKNAFIEELGKEHRDQITIEEMIDIKEVYGISLQAAIISARYYGIITPEYKRWWYSKYLENNPWEKELGHYVFPETLGREKRIESVIKGIAPKETSISL